MTEQEKIEIEVDGAKYPTRPTRNYLARKPVVVNDPKRIMARIPGAILSVLAEPGREVARGDGIVVFEAMKMRNTIASTIAGRVKTLHVETGTLVAKGDLLVELE